MRPLLCREPAIQLLQNGLKTTPFNCHEGTIVLWDYCTAAEKLPYSYHRATKQRPDSLHAAARVGTRRALSGRTIKKIILLNKATNQLTSYPGRVLSWVRIQ